MPEFYIKKGLADVLLTDWIAAHTDEPFIRVNIEVESSHERLRRSFHGLLLDWFNCGEWSCNGAEIHTMEKFKNYYKLAACNNKPLYYIYKNDKFKTINDLVDAYPKPEYHMFDIGLEPKSWTKMTKKEKSNALNILLTEIKYSMTNDQKVLKRVAEITGDLDMLNDINYHKNIGE
jgi:hypothetical protein